MGRKQGESRVSMKDVAAIAGVSTMTVSRALRDPDSVSPEARARILKVIDSVGYVPNRVAGSLSSSRTTLVALIVPNLRNALHAETIQGISDVLHKHGFQLMISDCSNSLEREEALLRTYIAQQVCGVILHNTAHSPAVARILKAANIPCVETGNLASRPLDMTVSYSNFEAGKAAAAHLVSLGYKRLAFASLPTKNRDRIMALRKGFLAGARKAGVPIKPELALEVGPGLASGAAAMVKMLKLAPKTQGAFFAGDVLGIGALFECQRRGIKVPAQFAIVASDDGELLQNTVPPLTTVRYPRYEIGVRAAELIIARTAGKDPGPVNEDLGFEVIRRGST